MLDHSDMQSVHVYYAFGDSMLAEVDSALAKCGSGVKIRNFFRAAPPRSKNTCHEQFPPDRQIWLPPTGEDAAPDDESAENGGCGRESEECRLDIPLACYVCHKFQPYAEGPHERALALANARLHSHGHIKSAQSELTLVIAAIEEVKDECDAIVSSGVAQFSQVNAGESA
jgi:hypothetical protein